MKKLFLIATVCVAGFASAKNSIELSQGIKSIGKFQLETQLQDLKKIHTNSFPVTFSCGVTVNYSVDEGIPASTVLALIWFNDYLICG